MSPAKSFFKSVPTAVHPHVLVLRVSFYSYGLKDCIIKLYNSLTVTSKQTVPHGGVMLKAKDVSNLRNVRKTMNMCLGDAMLAILIYAVSALRNLNNTKQSI